MNVRNFLAHRELCPICNSKLNFHCQSKNNDATKYVNGKLNINLPINSYALSPIKQNSFNVNLIIDIDSNDFEIDFLDKALQSLNAVSLNRLESFKLFIARINNIVFYNRCICNKYNYSSKINFNYKNSKLENVFVENEYVFLEKFTFDKLKTYSLYNDYIENKALLMIALTNLKTDSVDSSLIHNNETIEIPIVEITDPDKLLSTLDMVSVFS